MKILLVEDDKAIASIMKSTLEQEHDVVVFDSGLDAYVSLMNGEFDLLVTDLMVPIYNGKELIKLVRSWSSNFPIIVVSAIDDSSHDYYLEDYKISEFIKKPFSTKDLLSAVNNIG